MSDNITNEQTKGSAVSEQNDQIESDDSAWVERSSYWHSYKPPRSAGRTRFDAQKQPLILSGHGASLRVEHGALVVQNGFTHYPQVRESWRLFPGDPRMPPRIVLLNASGYLTFDVLSWLGERQIPIIRLGWQGDVTTFCGSRKRSRFAGSAMSSCMSSGRMRPSAANGAPICGRTPKADSRFDCLSNEAPKLHCPNGRCSPIGTTRSSPWRH